MTADIREKAIEAAARAIYNCWRFQTGWIPWVEDSPTKWHASWQDMAHREARAAIAAYERAMWRPVEEAPPGAFGLVVSIKGDIDIACRLSDRWLGSKRDVPEPRIFRPLPLPPEDEA